MTSPLVVVWGDTPTSDRLYVELIGLPGIPLEGEQFVSLDDEAFLYLAKIEGRPANFSPTLPREDGASLSAIYKKLEGDIKLMAMERYSLLHYNARLIARKHRETEEISEVLSAPRLGTIACAATDQEAIEFLGLPPMEPALQFGHIFHTTIPLCLSLDVLRHHLLIAGTTGQGKTTLATNIVTAAQRMQATIFLMDFKPDYQHVEVPLRGRPIARQDVTYWNLNERKGYREDTRQVNVHFSELHSELFLRSVTPSDTQSPMYDTFVAFYDTFVDYMRQAGRTTWTCDEFFEEIPKHPKDTERLARYAAAGDVPHAATLAATHRIKKGKPSWVDSMRPGRGLVAAATPQASFFEEPQFLAPGHVHVIQANIQRDKHYGLFMATLMQKILDTKEREGLRHPVLIVIDEAQDIFNGGAFGRLCEGEIASVIRKGRSQNIGVILAVQSADSVPALIANCLNSTIAFRHNSEEAAGFIKKQLGASAAQLQELERGNVVLKLFGAKSVVRATLDREAFQLVKHE